VEKSIKEMRDKNATEDDEVPGDVPKRLGEDGIRIITQRSTTYMKLEGGPRISLKLQ
jgi:hypothetical protein